MAIKSENELKQINTKTIEIRVIEIEIEKEGDKKAYSAMDESLKAPIH